jgi:hypothetical protein
MYVAAFLPVGVGESSREADFVVDPGFASGERRSRLSRIPSPWAAEGSLGPGSSDVA